MNGKQINCPQMTQCAVSKDLDTGFNALPALKQNVMAQYI